MKARGKDIPPPAPAPDYPGAASKSFNGKPREHFRSAKSAGI